MSYTDAQVWTVIAVLGIATFLIRFSFLGLVGDRPMPHGFCACCAIRPSRCCRVWWRR